AADGSTLVDLGFYYFGRMNQQIEASRTGPGEHRLPAHAVEALDDLELHTVVTCEQARNFVRIKTQADAPDLHQAAPQSGPIPLPSQEALEAEGGRLVVEVRYTQPVNSCLGV